MMNTPDSPCEPRLTYSFKRCISQKGEKEAGCSLPWETFSGQAYPPCSTVEEIMYNKKKFPDISTNTTKSPFSGRMINFSEV